MGPFSAKLQGSGSGRIILSYVIDWIVIILIAAVAGAITYVHPNHRPFSVVDPDISFPYVAKEKISNGVLFILALVVPAIFIVLVSFLFIPGPKSSKQVPKSQLWKRKLWEWNAGWLGLALSMAVTGLLTDGLKLLLGKPRPDMLARCQPDLPKVASFVLGGVNDRISEGTLVSWTICQATDMKKLREGFQAFPSGHASFSSAGLVYLALWLCAKFAVRIPSLPPYPRESAHRAAPPNLKHGRMGEELNSSAARMHNQDFGAEVRDEGAAPPVYTIILPLVPISLALYISSTRYSDFKHHGSDIFAGAILGIIVAWLSFRLYHPPISRGAGWAWSQRSASSAFGIGVGTVDYVEIDNQRKKTDDLEVGVNGNGMGEASTVADRHRSTTPGSDGKAAVPSLAHS